MIQREQRHTPGTFPVCARCEKEPRHYMIGGGHSASGPSTERHMLECRCHNTLKYGSLEAAAQEWRDLFAVRQVAQVSVITKRSAAK